MKTTMTFNPSIIFNMQSICNSNTFHDAKNVVSLFLSLAIYFKLNELQKWQCDCTLISPYAREHAFTFRMWCNIFKYRIFTAPSEIKVQWAFWQRISLVQMHQNYLFTTQSASEMLFYYFRSFNCNELAE